MDVGKCWLIIEKDYFSQVPAEDVFHSMISARRSVAYVRDYVEQLYIDKFASLEQKISYKKNRLSWPYPAQYKIYTGDIVCGREPWFVALFCHHVNLKGQYLQYSFKRFMGEDDDGIPILKVLSSEVKIK